MGPELVALLHTRVWCRGVKYAIESIEIAKQLLGDQDQEVIKRVKVFDAMDPGIFRVFKKDTLLCEIRASCESILLLFVSLSSF
mmetsp:Transcript_29233/g.85006  ORF Transcript_29233/g.85006 Transcript_29233/m.85006 type:complete len:84 (-) Transcript_29233:986-1237(-)